MQDGPYQDTDKPDPQTVWAERRTDWAEDRTLQANERTFAGWMRTGMASVAVALGLKAVFGDFEPTWLAKAVATIFLIAALVTFWSARNRARATQSRLHVHAISPLKTSYYDLIAAILSIGTVATGYILWRL